MRTCRTLALLGLLLIGGCGGGDSSFGSGTPKATLSATALGFGTEIVGKTSSAIPVTMTNTGTAALSITSIAATTNFGETDDCGQKVATGANCTVNVTFEPTAAGSLAGTITIMDNAVGSPQTIVLTGTGSLSGPSCSGTVHSASSCEREFEFKSGLFILKYAHDR